MSNLALRVQGLGKSYQIGALQQPYKTLRDTLNDVAKIPARMISSLARRNGHHHRPQTETLWALRDITFDVKPGEVVGIIGRNGAGKSTLLKVLSRITEPTEGFAEIHGRVGSLLEVGTGFHPELTGRENIYLNGAILGMAKVDIDRQFDAIVAFAEVERFIDTAVKHYSSGMYLRLAFAVAAHLEPEILVVDEVLAVGDQSFQTKCLNKMQDVSGSGRTVLFVSHNMGAIHRLCTRCIFLDEGKIVADGSPEHVIQTYVSQGLVQRPEYRQEHNAQKPINLRRAALLNPSDEVASEFRFDQGLKVLVEYEVNRPVSNCSVWIGLRTAQEEMAFDTADTDSDASLLKVREPGYYRTVVEIPPRWLNYGSYYVIVGIADLSYKVNHDRVELSTFTILDVGVPEKGRRGILQPYLQWETNREPIHQRTPESVV